MKSLGRERIWLINLLDEYRTLSQQEHQDLRMMRAMARSLERPFSREQLDGHFTGSGVIVDETGTRTCLVYHVKLRCWLQPGGHVEEDFDGWRIHATALREAREETGLPIRLLSQNPLDVEIHRIPEVVGTACHNSVPAHWHYDVRFLLAGRYGPVKRENESTDVAWYTWDEAIAITHKQEPGPGGFGLRRMLEKARQIHQF